LNKKIHKILAAFLLLLLPALSMAQQSGLGVQLHYNYALNLTGAGVRYELPLTTNLFVAPQVKYLPDGLNSIHEMYVGVAFHYVLYRTEQTYWYALGGADGNYWINYYPSVNDGAKEFNLLPLVGAGGGINAGRFIIFAEIKYNPVWKEASSDLGLKFNRAFNSKKSKRIKTQLKCPKLR
jgi:hypothetical protein